MKNIALTLTLAALVSVADARPTWMKLRQGGGASEDEIAAYADTL